MAAKKNPSQQIEQILTISPVISVLTVERLEDAVPLARALVLGGLPVMTVTLRTPCALAAISAIRAAVGDAVVGAATLSRPVDFPQSKAAGAQFGVTPGLSQALIACSLDAGFPLLPGCMTPTELIAVRIAGFNACNLFPAALAGGAAMIRALSAPFPDHLFCPTGGVTLASAAEYLSLKNVPCVGGSWVAPSSAIENRDWAAIETLARAAAELRRSR